MKKLTKKITSFILILTALFSLNVYADNQYHCPRASTIYRASGGYELYGSGDGLFEMWMASTPDGKPHRLNGKDFKFDKVEFVPVKGKYMFTNCFYEAVDPNTQEKLEFKFIPFDGESAAFFSIPQQNPYYYDSGNSKICTSSEENCYFIWEK